MVFERTILELSCILILRVVSFDDVVEGEAEVVVVVDEEIEGVVDGIDESSSDLMRGMLHANISDQHFPQLHLLLSCRLSIMLVQQHIDYCLVIALPDIFHTQKRFDFMQVGEYQLHILLSQILLVEMKDQLHELFADLFEKQD